MTPQTKTEAPQVEGRARIHARFGWTLLLLSLVFGTGLEGLEGFRWAPLVGDALTQRLWSLAHFHGAALGLLNLIYVQWADTQALGAATLTRASRTLLLGSAALPLGFLLGGFAHPEGDPSFGIFLAPVGALLVLYTVAAQTVAAWRGPQGR
ncbi:hypothetical protein [Hyalangium rubrum]|uniref:Peptidase S54 rhomboid domain-containing protein n=1 Tax=Hyalangium rubrum TaxID=3103134 RepID=A0ABU5H593_9BACT|nr:hypothetical protein [Hyalangium sp. s54d21]MDY7228649.1 hypothetical protein [Hyalangium sp. s54d21]